MRCQLDSFLTSEKKIAGLNVNVRGKASVLGRQHGAYSKMESSSAPIALHIDRVISQVKRTISDFSVQSIYDNNVG